jgi:hypothetical protein
MIVGSVLDFFRFLFGYSPPSRTPLRSCIRGFLFLLNFLSIAMDVVNSTWSLAQRSSFFGSELSSIFGAFQDFALYIWRLRAGDFHGKVTISIYKDFSFCLISAVLVFANLGMTYAMVYDVIDYGDRPAIVSSVDSSLLENFSKITTVSSAVTQFVGFMVYWELAMVLKNVANDIELTPFACCSSGQLEVLCRTIKSKFAFLSLELELPLTLLYASYFLHLVTDIPGDLSRAECENTALFTFCKNLKHLLELSIVVSAGNSLMDTCGRLKREARKRKEFRWLLRSRILHLSPSNCMESSSSRFNRDGVHFKRADFLKDHSGEVKILLRSQHGVEFGIGQKLTYASCCCFLGLSWGFALTVFQSKFDAGEVRCER